MKCTNISHTKNSDRIYNCRMKYVTHYMVESIIPTFLRDDIPGHSDIHTEG